MKKKCLNLSVCTCGTMNKCKKDGKHPEREHLHGYELILIYKMSFFNSFYLITNVKLNETLHFSNTLGKKSFFVDYLPCVTNHLEKKIQTVL